MVRPETLTGLIARVDALPGGRDANADLATDALYLRSWYAQYAPNGSQLQTAIDDATAAVVIHNRRGNAAGTAMQRHAFEAQLAECIAAGVRANSTLR